MFGVEVYSLTDDKILYALNADKLFVPGSVTKLLTEGAALSLLGADYRFHTRMYRTGPLSKTGGPRRSLTVREPARISRLTSWSGTWRS